MHLLWRTIVITRATIPSTAGFLHATARNPWTETGARWELGLAIPAGTNLAAIQRRAVSNQCMPGTTIIQIRRRRLISVWKILAGPLLRVAPLEQAETAIISQS